MLTDCRNGKIDYIIVKSISRLARNTVDMLQIVRELYNMKIYLYFEKENINTSKMESELLLAILSSMAEAESKSIAQNEKWSIQKRFEQGTYIIGCPPYGYKNDKGKMVVVPEQAKIVKRIFSEFLTGNGGYLIANGLNEDGIPSKKNGKWNSGTVTAIIKNEKYIGDVLFQKTYTDEHFNRKKNTDGEKAQYYVRDHHEAIISREDYENAQKLLAENCSRTGISKNSGMYLQRNALSGKIICGVCGTTWKRRTHYTKHHGDYRVYACASHLKDKQKCGTKYIREETFQNAFCNVMNKLHAGWNTVLQPLLENLSSVNDAESKNRLEEINAQLEKNMNQRTQLNNLFMKQYLDTEAYTEENNILMKEDLELAAERDAIRRTLGCDSSRIAGLQELIKHVRNAKPMTQYDEALLEKYVDHITVNNRNSITFVLRCGLSLKEEI